MGVKVGAAVYVSTYMVLHRNKKRKRKLPSKKASDKTKQTKDRI
jgi:hypothetical protein